MALVAPDVDLLEIAATALGLASPPATEPLEYEGLTDRFLPDQMLSGLRLGADRSDFLRRQLTVDRQLITLPGR